MQAQFNQHSRPFRASLSSHLKNRTCRGTSAVSTYSTSASVALRTNVLAYADNGIDLLTATNPLGVQVISNAFNAYHQVLTNYNALGEMTVLAYYDNHQINTISRPSGLLSSYTYFTSGDAVNRLEQAADYALIGGATVVGYRTNSYTWTNGLVLTRTDPRGLTVTGTWDSLQRLRRVDYPDGTFITNVYDKLDLVEHVDRMGFPASYGYNVIRQRTAATNANGTVTLYSYCSCGALESLTNAFGTPAQAVTRYTYDNQGNLIQTVGPDNYTVNYSYNALGQVTNLADGLASITNWYNNQGLKYAVSNAFGCAALLAYDALDRATNNLDANAVSVSSSFDNLGRVLARANPDTGVEQFGYSPNTAGPTSYTNQLGSNVVNFVYDPLGRKTVEQCPGVTTNQFAYAPVGDLLTLTDGKNQTTTWVYDQYGRATNKLDALNNLIFIYGYDANSRLTNRWTPAKGATTYRYDALGNLTNIVYPTSPAITLQVRRAEPADHNG